MALIDGQGDGGLYAEEVAVGTRCLNERAMPRADAAKGSDFALEQSPLSTFIKNGTGDCTDYKHTHGDNGKLNTEACAMPCSAISLLRWPSLQWR
jgi:hypothetical protein